MDVPMIKCQCPKLSSFQWSKSDVLLFALRYVSSVGISWYTNPFSTHTEKHPQTDRQTVQTWYIHQNQCGLVAQVVRDVEPVRPAPPPRVANVIEDPTRQGWLKRCEKKKKKELRNCGIKSQQTQTHVHVSKSLCLQFFGDIASDLSWHGHVHSSHTEYHAKRVTSPSRPVSKRFEECDVKLADFFDEVFECVCANMFCIPRCSAATIFWSSFACYVAAAVLWRMEFSMSELF